ncbi:mercuric reductase [Echinicola pacifica]|uniref:Mercuric reductase n=1 Tax=Echinicola pacifica TaxID=346377 RepID=A0A918PVP8_9BACT|nr:mercuric reductase [Echinicola pacifica]GGZ22516.1 mercuric reductase [Echinicola pacifica]
MKNYDAIIIGAGQAGMPLAKKISSKGQTVALIERRAIGGTCINDGCSPTKTMGSSAKVAHMVSRAGDFGVNISGYTIDQQKIKARKNEIIELFRGGAEKSLEKQDEIDILLGEASFVDNHHIDVAFPDESTQRIYGKRIFINSGTSPRVPEIKGLKESPFLTSTSIMELNETPEHLIIMGGGYIGLEFAQMFRRFGSKVTIIDRGDRLVKQEDEDVSEEVSKIFQEDGIDLWSDSEVSEVSYKDGYTLKIKTSKGDKSIKGSHLLVAVGRTPNIPKGIENTKITLSKSGHIETDDYLRTGEKKVYALGDVAGSPPFTHIAYHDAHLVFQTLYQEKPVSKQDRLVPYCMFIDPQLARIGLNEQEAKKKQIKYKSAKFLMEHSGRALETDQTRGFFKVLVDPKSKTILGATILSMDGGEIMAVLQMAMLGGITYDTIASMPIAHPTLAESLNNLMMQLE